MTILKRHWLAIVLALVTALLLFGFVHRCSAHRDRSGAGGTPSGRSLNNASVTPGDTPATPISTTTWLASLDWEAIGMGVGGLLSGIATLYQIILKWRAGAVTIEAVIDQGKSIFGEAKEVQSAFKKPVGSVPPTPPMPPASNDVYNAAMKMDKPVTMEKPKDQ